MASEGLAPSQTKDPFKELCDACEQLQQDISLFRTMCTEEIKDPRHEDLITLAEDMLQRISGVLRLDKSYTAAMPPDALFKMWCVAPLPTNL